jgi:prolyl 4-hydroxylase
MSTPDSAEALLARARSGDLRALTLLGKRFLVGEGVTMAPDKGVALLREASARGDAEAAAQLATCAAWGVAQSRDINAALDHLQRAAQLGWKSAQRELELLARQSGDPAALRRKVDISAWTAPSGARVISERPRIVAIEHFVTSQECEWLIERGRPRLTRAKVYRDSAQAQTADTRTNTETSFTIFNVDVALSLIRDRISAAAGAATSHFEVTKLLHYSPGEHFALHADFIEPKTPELVREIQLRGQRAQTFLVYLNDGFEGGATEFPRLGLEYKGGCGDALLFSNVDATGAPDYETVHAGKPPTSGEKWLLSQWIRTRPVGG